MSKSTEKRSLIMKLLDYVERIGNKLPDPIILFVILSLFVIMISAIVASFGVTVEHPGNKGEFITVNSLLSKEGIAYLFESLITNFTNFAPLGTVLVTMLGIGIAERSGLIGSALRALILSVPKRLVTAALVFGGVMSSMAADAGYVVLVPLGGVVFAVMNRNPLAGIAAAFSGVSGGFSANLLLTSLDPLLGGITKQATEIIDPAYAANINYAMNYYFMFVSVFFLTIVGTIVTEKIVEPRLGNIRLEKKESFEKISQHEKKGLWIALVAFLLTAVVLAFLVIPPNAPLRGDGDIISSPFFKHLVPAITLLFLVPGLVYGAIVKTITSSYDVSKMLSETMATMGSYIVLSFVAGQFVAYFAHSNLGLVVAVKGADFLKTTGFKGIALIIAFIFVAAIINLFIGSSSAKWAIMAPVFVPILMRLGYSPEFTQLAYRLADSSTNIISPLMAYFAIVIAFAQKYDKSVGIGTLITMMLPYSITFLLGWIVLLIIWMILGLPIGPGTQIHYP